MARTFKITGYMIDPNENYEEADIQRILERYSDLHGMLKVIASPEWEWDDGCPENYAGCSTEDYERRFK